MSTHIHVHVPTSRQALTSFSLFSDSSVVVHKLIAFSIDLGFLLFFLFFIVHRLYATHSQSSEFVIMFFVS